MSWFCKCGLLNAGIVYGEDTKCADYRNASHEHKQTSANTLSSLRLYVVARDHELWLTERNITMKLGEPLKV